MKRRARNFLVSAGLVCVMTVAFYVTGAIRHNLADRHPDYQVDLRIPAGEPHPLRIGFGTVAITPDVPETWTDSNGNRRFDRGEPFDDANGNGRLDGVWLAGFHQRRAATGVHDDLWARTMVIDDGTTSVAFVAVDSIGFMHDYVIEVRERVRRRTHVDYVIVCSTHSHSTPDVQGLWGRFPLISGVDPGYVERVIDGATESIVAAAQSAQPAILRCAVVPATLAGETTTDLRRPIVKDAAMRILQAVAGDSGETLGTFVVWGNHPETTSAQLLVSSDFPHYLRDALEHGISDGKRIVIEGLGGTTVYASGAIGGLMSTTADVTVRDPVSDAAYAEPSFEKAQAQGRQLAMLAMDALRGPDVIEMREASIGLRARTVELPMTNRLLRLAAALGVIDRGFTHGGHTRTEIAFLRLGPISLLAVPGEIYPEIVNGGIETPPGADYPVTPVETPPLRELMPGDVTFVVGLANDAIGYIIPKSEWDNSEPWIYGETDETYGEIVSLGADTGPDLYGALAGIIRDLNSGSDEP